MAKSKSTTLTDLDQRYLMKLMPTMQPHSDIESIQVVLELAKEAEANWQAIYEMAVSVYSKKGGLTPPISEVAPE